MKNFDYTAALGWALLAVGGSAQGRATIADSPATSFHITAPSLSAALEQFTQQSGVQLLWCDQINMPARAVVGEYTAIAALDQLLDGTPLHYTFVIPRTVTIRTVARPPDQMQRRSRTKTVRRRSHAAATARDGPDNAE